MCAINNSNVEWVFIDRKNNRYGLALLNRHLKNNESILYCVIHKIKKEAELTLNNTQIKEFYHFFKKLERERYMVFNLMLSSFTGNLKITCEESSLFWLKSDNIDIIMFYKRMAELFDLYRNCNCLQLFSEWDNIISRNKSKNKLLLDIN
jgi:hypothetical protein